MRQPTPSPAIREYLGVDRIEGPLVIVEQVSDAAYSEVVEIIALDGSLRLGQVLEISEGRAVVELWGESSGLRPGSVRVRFRGRPLEVPVAREMLGRTFDGLGRPRDGLPNPVWEDRVSVHGAPLNPARGAYPQDFIQTGISAIDGMNTLVRGQKLPIFSGSGLPHDDLAAQIACQARIAEEGGQFAIIFVALGVPHDTAEHFHRTFAASGTLNQAALFLNLADDPPMERVITPRVALSLAEFLAFQHDVHVLVIMTNMTNYGEALRELSGRRNEVPGRKGYPGYLYSDLASLYERCGRVHGRAGSITQVPILTMPNDDITHPIPDLTGYITEGQIFLSRDLHRQGIYPPINVLPSLSRLMKDSIGEGKTRADHPHLANQLYAAYAHVQQVRALAVVIGEEELSSVDRAYLEFGLAFERRFVAQGPAEHRDVEATLDLGWEMLSLLPANELTRVSQEEIQAHYRGVLDGHSR
ncbi:MAG: V-type ATP synthase subunit B [Ardenticatenaceae bacterium]|nr:V-type ATP synthase subunit B [Ardenticatenaceae bacterium]